MADEVQTGVARTGRMLACDYEDVRTFCISVSRRQETAGER